MAVQPVGVWGIDLGQCGLKALRLEEKEGQLVATAFDYVEYPKILSQPDADPDQLIREALDKFLSRNQLKGDQVAISVSGQTGLVRFVKLPPVEEKKIGDIVRFEAKQQIPFNLDEVVWDYQKIGQGMIADGFALDTEIGLFAMKRDVIGRALQQFKDVKVEVHLIQMTPLALCNFLAYDVLGKGGEPAEGGEESSGKKQAIVGLDIGTDSSNLVVTDGGRVIWQRHIPLGGNHFTRALTKDMKLTFAKAEHLKRNATKSPDLKKILASIKPVLSDFVGEVQRSLGFFSNTHRDVQIEYMIGLGNAFRLPGMQKYMAEKLSLEVKRLSKFERLTGDAVVTAPIFLENLPTFAVAYGLALQGLKKGRMSTNLLPPEIRVERIIRAKKPWAAAAAAALLLGLSSVVWGYGLQFNAFGGKTVSAAIQKSDEVVKAVDAAESKFNSTKTDALNERQAFLSILAGYEEQENWIRLSDFLSDVLIQPQDCLPSRLERLPDTFRDPKNSELQRELAAAQVALGEWIAWRAKVDKGEAQADQLPSAVTHLFLFNIEAVDCRYTDDLAAVWKTISNKQTFPTARIRPEDEKAPPKEKEKGWVIELRGYTYHDGKTVTVERVLAERIAQFAKSNKHRLPSPLLGSEGEQPTGQPSGSSGDAAAALPQAVSHPVVVRTYDKKAINGAFGNYEIIGRSEVASILGGGTGLGEGAGPPMGGPPIGKGGPPMGGPVGGMGGGPPSGGSGGTADPRAGWMPILVNAQAPAEPVTVKGGDATRTEFILVFFWREPTPSDKVFQPIEVADPTQGSGETMGGMR